MGTILSRETERILMLSMLSDIDSMRIAATTGYDGKALSFVQLNILMLLRDQYPLPASTKWMRDNCVGFEMTTSRACGILHHLRRRGYLTSESIMVGETYWYLGPLADELIERGVL